MTIRVLIVDDQAIIRAGLQALLELDPSIEVVGTGADGNAAIDLVELRRPDVVLMDIRMPGLDGLEATRRLTRQHPGVAVVILTTFDLDEYVFDAVRAGASGFLLKDGDGDDLVEAIHVVARGEALMSPRSLRRLIDRFAVVPSPSPTASASMSALTQREREVLVAIARGCSNDEIASTLAIGAATTKTHVRNLLAKLRCRDRAQLVIAAYEGGLVRLGE